MISDSHRIRMTCRDASRCVTAAWPAEQIDRLLGSLSVDPLDLTELTWGWERFGDSEPGDPFEGLESLAADAPWPSDPGNEIRIDLTYRAVLIDTPWVEAEYEGGVMVASLTREGSLRSYRCPHSIPDHWLVLNDPVAWQALRACREPREPEPSPGRARRILYEEFVPFLVEMLSRASLAEQTQGGRWKAPLDWKWAQLPQRARRHGGPMVEDVIAECHARWMMTPREDLDGDSPRSLMLRYQSWVDRDIDQRAAQWSRTLLQPAGLRVASSAYQAAVFGSHEFLLYYDLVRELARLTAAWLLVHPDADRNLLLRALQRRRETWAQSCERLSRGGWTVAEIIDQERRRIPLVARPDFKSDRCDCPICQMAAEPDFVVFESLDGWGQDWDWPFSSIPEPDVWREWYGDWYEQDPEFTELTLTDPQIESPPSRFELESWPTATLLLRIAADIADWLSQTRNSGMKVRVRDDFTRLHDAVMDPGWQSSAPIVARLVELLSQRPLELPNRHPKSASTIECLAAIGKRLAEAEMERIPATD